MCVSPRYVAAHAVARRKIAALTLEQVVGAYRSDAPLAHASTIPAAWYTDLRVFELELSTVFRRSWQAVARGDELRAPGDYIARELPGGEPSIAARTDDRTLPGLYNVRRQQAAAAVNGEP